jgi:hypothetical protein
VNPEHVIPAKAEISGGERLHCKWSAHPRLFLIVEIVSVGEQPHALHAGEAPVEGHRLGASGGAAEFVDEEIRDILVVRREPALDERQVAERDLRDAEQSAERLFHSRAREAVPAAKDPGDFAKNDDGNEAGTVRRQLFFE